MVTNTINQWMNVFEIIFPIQRRKLAATYLNPFTSWLNWLIKITEKPPNAYDVTNMNGWKASLERRISNITFHVVDILTTYLPCWWRGWCRGTAPCWGGWGGTRATPCARGGSAADWWAWKGWGAGWGRRSRPGPRGTGRAGGCWEGAPQSHLKGICKTKARQWSKSWGDDKMMHWAVGRTLKCRGANRGGRGGRKRERVADITYKKQTRLVWIGFSVDWEMNSWRQQRPRNNCSRSCQESLQQLRASHWTNRQMLRTVATTPLFPICGRYCELGRSGLGGIYSNAKLFYQQVSFFCWGKKKNKQNTTNRGREELKSFHLMFITFSIQQKFPVSHHGQDVKLLNVLQ